MGPIAKSTIKTSIVLGLRLMVQAATLLLVARVLGPEHYGAFAGVAALAVLLGTLASLGSNLVLLEAISKDPAQRDQVLPWAIPTILLVGSVLLAIFTMIGKVLLGGICASLTILLAIGLAEIWWQPLFGLIATEYHAQGRVAYSQLLYVAPLAFRMILAMSLVFLSVQNPLLFYAFGYGLASLLPLVISLKALEIPWPEIKKWRLPNIRELKNAAGFAVLNMTNLAPGELDKTLAARLLPMAEAGVYSAAARVIGAMVLPVIAMLLSALPRLFREGGETGQKGTNLTSLIFLITLLYSTVIAGLLWAIAPVFDSIFGHEYTNISDTLRLLCLAVPGLALRLAAGNVLMAFGRPWMRATFELAGVAVLFVSSVILTSQFGNMGMPLAWAVSELVMSVAGWSFIKLIRP